MNGVVPDIAQLANIREATRELAVGMVNFLTAHDLSAGHCQLFPQPANDGLSIVLGIAVEEFKALGWRIISHSSASVGFTDASKRMPVLFVSLLIERTDGKQLVHLGT